MSVQVEKMLWTVLSVGMWALSVWPPIAGVAPALQTGAGIVFGKTWMATPEQTRASKEEKRRSSMPPPEAFDAVAESAPTVPDRKAVKRRVP